MSLEDKLYPLLALYERSPEWIRGGVGRAFRLVPPSWRLGKAFGEFERMNLEVESWDTEQIAEYQWRELKRTLRHATSYCPYYEAAFLKAGANVEALRSPEDLKNLPLLEKQDLIDSRDQLCSRALSSKERLYITTGGSTGVPVGFYLQKGVSRPKEQAFLEAMWRRAGYDRSARVAVVRGHVTDTRSSGRVIRPDPTRGWLILSSYHLSDRRWPEYLEALESYRPDFLHAYPSAALMMAEFLEKAGQSWRLPMTAVLCGSERLTIPQKRLLQKVFGCPVYRWYGHSERVVLAGEGATSEHFHFFPNYGFTEFGEPDAEGHREVIGTSFHNMAMPLIRYRTGDFVRLLEPDGERDYPWQAAVEIVGREQEFLISGEGRRISLTAMNMHDAIFDDLYAVQFFQDEPGVAELRYVPTSVFRESALKSIAEGVQRKLGDDFSLSLRRVEETERTSRGKHKWLVSKIDP